jgi:hypothetical protein
MQPERGGFGPRKFGQAVISIGSSCSAATSHLRGWRALATETHETGVSGACQGSVMARSMLGWQVASVAGTAFLTPPFLRVPVSKGLFEQTLVLAEAATPSGRCRLPHRSFCRPSFSLCSGDQAGVSWLTHGVLVPRLAGHLKSRGQLPPPSPRYSPWDWA